MNIPREDIPQTTCALKRAQLKHALSVHFKQTLHGVQQNLDG